MRYVLRVSNQRLKKKHKNKNNQTKDIEEGKKKNTLLLQYAPCCLTKHSVVSFPTLLQNPISRSSRVSRGSRGSRCSRVAGVVGVVRVVTVVGVVRVVGAVGVVGVVGVVGIVTTVGSGRVQ